ncbi:hypothetical protein VB780_24640 [Leptolyngbya sp. CCNP1308]|uniref:VMAP-C domain-containing protein n=1 Tax=Leptolyngbya sp. CCNP1308 TaxID=3110255 RepID=UPI002B1F78EA|nr:hypothetical protein [Leptolyngbya sp. CCNP1308]MEA5451788.1 hypothetical protein [Leptolyngbya sp. CCNP1308]
MENSMGEEKLDARESQGLIYGQSSPVNQQYGDRQTTDTGGGDYSGGDIDKRTTYNFFLNSELPSAISHQSIEELSQSLRDLANDQAVKRAYHESLPPDAYVSRHKATDVLDMLTQLQEFRRLQVFLQRLAVDLDIPHDVNKQIEEIKDKLKEIETQNQSFAQPSDNQKSLQAYLQVVLRSDINVDRLRMNAWLIPDDTITDPAKRYQPLDLEDAQKGALCQIEEAPQIFNQFLNKALEWLMIHHYESMYELTVEIFLPLDYLCMGVDCWKLTNDQPFPDEFFLGADYQVIVRSQERLDIRYLKSRRNLWRQNWDRVKTYLAKTPQADDFENLEQVNSCNWDQLSYRLQQKLGLKATCGLDTNAKKDIFTCILKAASPIALLPRVDLSAMGKGDEINRLVTSGPLTELLALIQRIRQDAVGGSNLEALGSHLTVLWEDPNRLTPDALAQLRPPEQ